MADNPGAGVRAAAAQVVQEVRVRHRSLTQCLPSALAGRDARDAALVSSLATGVIRMLPRYLALSKQLLNRPPKRSDAILLDLLIVGLYQLEQTRIPAHAAVSATVSATSVLGRKQARGLINATLRRFLRERDHLQANIETDMEARWLFPAWLLQRLQQAWLEQWQNIVQASNQQPPMTLRINRRRCTTEAYATLLDAAGIAHQPVPGLPNALRLAAPQPMEALPGFGDGLVSIQDSAAQWAAELLDPQPGERVLDACAAPGGKSAALLERGDDRLALTAIDIDQERLAPLMAGLDRLGLHAEVCCMDLTAPPAGWPAIPFDCILLDAPCSATGVIRRHPDIKWLRREGDIANLARIQQQLLTTTWAMLKPGGRLLYTTCSILPEENEQQIKQFLEAQSDAAELPIPLPASQAATGIPPVPTLLKRQHGLQRLPHPDGGDGFFYALLERRTAPGQQIE